MTDVQIATLALAIVIPLAMLIYSNSRVSEAKETLRAEMGTLRVEMAQGRTEISAEIAQSRAETALALQRIDNKLDHVIETQARHSERLESLEERGRR